MVTKRSSLINDVKPGERGMPPRPPMLQLLNAITHVYSIGSSETIQVDAEY